MRLRIGHDLGSHFEIRRLVDVRVAEAPIIFDHRHDGRALDETDQGIATPGHGDVNQVFALKQSLDHGAIVVVEPVKGRRLKSAQRQSGAHHAVDLLCRGTGLGTAL
ncbi:MAG: hypothetical protein HC902_09775, partial [Calothrix sp. SM1_5_4]|nr:hypothetical protein [Calothrix sp. SM1_5_4]